MGCNCKNVKKLQNLVNANHEQIERKGINKVFYTIINGIQNLWIKLLVVIIIAIAIPIVFITLIITLFFKGRPTIPIPKKIAEKLIKRKKSS